jgi:sRNA-binding regulator protein Hfq
MNSFVYENFGSDMLESVNDFTSTTDYFIDRVSRCSISLTNKKKILIFFLEATNLNSEIKNFDGTSYFSLYELFEKENIIYKYPINTELKLPYEEWNKYKVKKILEVLNSDLRKYI